MIEGPRLCPTGLTAQVQVFHPGILDFVSYSKLHPLDGAIT